MHAPGAPGWHLASKETPDKHPRYTLRPSFLTTNSRKYFMQNAGKLVKSIAAMQLKMAQVQKELAAAEFTGKAANGLVELVVNGQGEALRATMSPAVRDEDADTIAALFVVAFNDANRQKEAMSKSKLAGVGAGLIPTGFKLPGF
jgi:nucleoid-associated protein EbfC